MRRARQDDVTADDVEVREGRPGGHGGHEHVEDAGEAGGGHEYGLVLAPAVRRQADQGLSQEGQEGHDAHQDAALFGAQPLPLGEHRQVGSHAAMGCNQNNTVR